MEKKAINYTVIDPSYGGNAKNRNLVPKFIEQCTKEDLSCNTIVMSHVFEHFYNPIDILKKLEALAHIEYIYISFPDLENFLKDGTYLVLTPEHTFYVDTNYLISLFLYYGFHLKRSYSHEHHSVFFEFVRINDNEQKVFPSHNDNVTSRVSLFFTNLQQNTQRVNNTMDTSIQSFIWPCSMHTLFVLAFGLDKKKVTFVLDNSPLKIGRYLFGHNLECQPFSRIIESDNKKNIILAGGCYNKEVLKQLQKNPNNYVYIV